MNITVFCGSVSGKNAHYQLEAEELAHWIGEKGHRLIYGGSSQGIMGAVADVVASYEGRVTGIMYEALSEREPVFERADQLVCVDSMSKRKELLFEEGDIYVALFGGPGTLEEIADVLSWHRIGILNKPILIYNEGGYYNSLRAQYETMIEGGFVTKDFLDNVHFMDEMYEIIEFLEKFHAGDNKAQR